MSFPQSMTSTAPSRSTGVFLAPNGQRQTHRQTTPSSSPGPSQTPHPTASPAHSSDRCLGTITKWDANGTGYIQVDGGPSLFCFHKNITSGTPAVNARVGLCIGPSAKCANRQEAFDVGVLQASSSTPAAKSTLALPDSRASPSSARTAADSNLVFAGIVVDGYMFAKSTKYDIVALDRLRLFVKETIRTRCGTANVVFPDQALHLFHPNPADAGMKLKIPLQQQQCAQLYLHNAEQKGWQITQSSFKMVDGKWKATAEDVKFSYTASKISQQGFFDPVGGNPDNVTLNHLFVVTTDTDHLATLETFNKELRWCLSPNGFRHQKFSAWGERTLRLIELPEAVCQTKKKPANAAGATGAASTAGQAERRSQRCQDWLGCSDRSCTFLHEKLAVILERGLTGRVYSNQLRETQGKTKAITQRTPIKLCRHDHCKFGPLCTFGHLVDASLLGALETSATDEATSAAVPPGHVRVGRKVVRLNSFQDNAGRQRALAQNPPSGALCKNQDTCPSIAACTFLHYTAEAAQNLRLHREVAAAKSTGPKSAPTKTQIRCCICDEPASPDEALGCSAKHYTCQVCLEPYITVTWAECPRDFGANPSLKCPVPECNVTFSERQVACCVSEETYMAYRDVLEKAHEAEIRAEEQARFEKLLRMERSEAERVQLQNQLALQYPNALMCPQCRHGPVDFGNCADLRAHHGQRVGAAVIDNSCKACGFFTERRENWLVWDKVLRSNPGAATTTASTARAATSAIRHSPVLPSSARPAITSSPPFRAAPSASLSAQLRAAEEIRQVTGLTHVSAARAAELVTFHGNVEAAVNAHFERAR